MKADYNLTTGDINKTLIKLSLPLMLTALIQVAYNFVDVLFLGRLGSEVVAGVGIAFFIFFFAASLSLIPRVGMGVYASRAYGSDNKKDAVRVMHNGFILALIIGFVYTILVFTFKNFFIGAFSLSPEASQYGEEYLFYSGLLIMLFIINPVITQSFIVVGDSITPFKINTLGALTNIVLDPIAIFGLGGFGGWGVKGAALASGIGQLVITICFLISIYRRDGLIKKALTRFDFKLHWLVDILKLGLPAALLHGINHGINIVLNGYTSRFGDNAVAAATIGNQIESVTWNTTDGIQVGIQVLVGQNFGLGNMKRVREAVRASLRLVMGVGLISGLVFLFFREGLMKIFVPDDLTTIGLGASYLLIMSVCQLFYSTEIGATGVFNGLGDSKTPATIGLIFNGLKIPLALILMSRFGVLGVWSAISLANILKGITDIINLRKRALSL